MSPAVRGGVGSLAVQYAELARTSARLRGEGGALLGLAAARHRLLADGDLLASAVLCPGGFARVEAALLAALDGPCGLLRAGAGLELRAGQLLVAVARYHASDLLEVERAGALRWLLVTAPALVPVTAGAGLGRAGLGWAGGVIARGGDPLAALEKALVEHPGVVDGLVGAVTAVSAPLAGGLAGPLPVLGDQAFRAVTGQALLPRDLAEACGLLALLYRDARPVYEQRADAAAEAVLVPAGVGDLLARLDHRNTGASPARGTQGDVGVTRVVTAGGDGRPRVSWIVDLPGTKDWQLDPRERAGVNDLASNLELIAGIENARVDALLAVLADAGVQPDEPVMLVGHSQGGMVAMRAAQAVAGRFQVTHVVTAGSPVGGMTAPDGVRVLSLENAQDVVPRTDGRQNPDTAGHLTVLFDHHGPTVADNHGTGTAYLPAARALDRTADEAVRAWLDDAQAFLAGADERTSATTTVYTVSNDTDGDGRVDRPRQPPPPPASGRIAG